MLDRKCYHIVRYLFPIGGTSAQGFTFFSQCDQSLVIPHIISICRIIQVAPTQAVYFVTSVVTVFATGISMQLFTEKLFAGMDERNSSGSHVNNGGQIIHPPDISSLLSGG